MPKLRAEAMSLAELLARYSNYTVPDFQRVYGWGEPQIKRLLSDLESAIERGGWLYLGDIYLASEPKSSQAEIADGQQRIATLSMFCAAGRDLAEDAAEADRLHALLVAPGANRGAAAYRYAPRDLDVAFFRRWVQEPGATRRHPAVNDAEEDVDGADQPLSESQTNIIVNRDLIVQKLESLGPAGRGKLFSFLDTSAEVTVHTADKLEDVRYAYASTHSRGLAQAEVDKLKAELLGDCRQDVRHRLATLWEDCEARLGKERLTDLLGALVFVEAERKPQLSLEADLAKVFGLPANVQKFIEKTLVPSALAYERILAAGKGQRAIKRATPNGRRLRRIDGHLVTLMRTSHDTWKGPAILALRTLRDKALEKFLRDLERLAAVLMIVGVEPNKVFERYGAVVRELKGNGPAEGLRARHRCRPPGQGARASGRDPVRRARAGALSHAGAAEGQRSPQGRRGNDQPAQGLLRARAAAQRRPYPLEQAIPASRARLRRRRVRQQARQPCHPDARGQPYGRHQALRGQAQDPEGLWLRALQGRGKGEGVDCRRDRGKNRTAAADAGRALAPEMKPG